MRHEGKTSLLEKQEIMQLEGNNNCILVTELWMIFLPLFTFLCFGSPNRM